MIYRPVPYIIKDIVDNLRDKYTEEKILPYFDFGTTVEVVNRLKAKSEVLQYSDKRYPLIWFLIDGSVKESVGDVRSNNRIAKGLTIIICNQTEREFTSTQRYETNFIPVLRPIYDAFMYHMKTSTLVRSSNGFEHEYYENLFWGNEGLYGATGNIFDDMLDAIIIKGLDLMIIEKC